MNAATIGAPVMIAAALALASCTGSAPTLPDDRVERAATCGVIAAFRARAATADIQAPLPFDAQGRIIHYALLGAIEGESFSQDTAAAINARMSAIQERLGGTDWEDLVPACAQVFPESDKTDVQLPADTLDSRLGCDALGDFLSKSMASQDSQYGSELAGYAALSAKLDQSSMVPALRRRAGEDREAQQAERRKALARIIRAGQPMAVMRTCMSRYG